LEPVVPETALAHEYLRTKGRELAVIVRVISPLDVPPRVEPLATERVSEPSAVVVAGVFVPTVMPAGRPVAAIVAAILFAPKRPANGIVIVVAVSVAPAAFVGSATASFPTSMVVADTPSRPAAPETPAGAFAHVKTRTKAILLQVTVRVMSPRAVPPRVAPLATVSTRDPAADAVPGVLVATVIPVGRPDTAIVVAAREAPTHPENGIVMVETETVAPAGVVGIVTASLPMSIVVAEVPSKPARPLAPCAATAYAVVEDALVYVVTVRVQRNCPGAVATGEAVHVPVGATVPLAAIW
jgi:hypothetical protein